ncbi:hypothetical protein F5144DRAFT_23848 [Chaetomium tenue]|uniref:Uncharacterized protein n=1 Tax=Chaetomium tenue TaxID=1854479 RepID=A0ACB7PNL3_9PEZI|nr:hypothetical protein F5144DRAFT_23848 [Chaetomium globosum]
MFPITSSLLVIIREPGAARHASFISAPGRATIAEIRPQGWLQWRSQELLHCGNGSGLLFLPVPASFRSLPEKPESACGSLKASLARIMAAGNRLRSWLARVAGQARLARPDSIAKIHSPQASRTLDCVLPLHLPEVRRLYFPSAARRRVVQVFFPLFYYVDVLGDRFRGLEVTGKTNVNTFVQPSCPERPKDQTAKSLEQNS